MSIFVTTQSKPLRLEGKAEAKSEIRYYWNIVAASQTGSANPEILNVLGQGYIYIYIYETHNSLTLA